MPIYEFQCGECATRFDELVRSQQALSDIHCPNCHSQQVQRLMSAFGFSTSSGSLVGSSSGSSCGTCSSKHCSTCH
ncbi:MAG: zinc ribbon domain-containing protein [candidate division KSB1 bacterium]|nr:zinc ribbon domain-containing protein [candidate division KSB1 bacterium]MDZ7319539.1 zinc ribbon domain-containing protein [candidate division KSB1 bacterium]MDZ7339816.1 zinc ribbon domain-containing protein [candidate division KSB1 bacterium]